MLATIGGNHPPAKVELIAKSFAVERSSKISWLYAEVKIL